MWKNTSDSMRLLEEANEKANKEVLALQVSNRGLRLVLEEAKAEAKKEADKRRATQKRATKMKALLSSCRDFLAETGLPELDYAYLTSGFRSTEDTSMRRLRTKQRGRRRTRAPWSQSLPFVSSARRPTRQFDRSIRSSMLGVMKWLQTCHRLGLIVESVLTLFKQSNLTRHSPLERRRRLQVGLPRVVHVPSEKLGS